MIPMLPIKKGIKNFVTVLGCCWFMSGPLMAWAATTDEFTKDQAYANSLRQTPNQAMQAYPAANNVPGYSDQPPQADYYGGVEQQSTPLKSDAANAAAQPQDQAVDHGAGNTVNQAFLTRPHYTINSQSAMIQNGQLVEADSKNITNGVSDQYVDCQAAPTNCQPTWSTHTCVAPVQLGNPVCTDNLVGQVTPGKSVVQTVHVTVKGTPKFAQFPQGVITVNLGSGAIQSSNPFMQATLDHPIGISSCQTLSINQKQVIEQGTQTTWQQLPSCQNHLVMKVAVKDQLYYKPYQSTITLTLHIELPPTVTTRWINDCSNLDPLISAGVCQLKQSQCTEGQATKIIDGVPVTASCWQKTNQYTCQSNTGENTCAPLEQKGCQEVGSQCNQVVNGVCTQYQNQYQCPEKTCQGFGMICGGNFFCVDGNCAPNTPSQASSEEFGQSATDLAAASGAGQDVVNQQPPNENDIHIFTGQPMHCREMAAGFSNCCTNHGWGQNMNLTKCSSEEQQLGHARQKGLAIRVGGTYCSHYVHTPVGKVCTVKSEGFCVFPDDIPLDTQRDGRPQLGMGWGSTHYPDCRGLTPDEISRIDFSKVDYSNYEQTVMDNTNVPDSDALQQQINQQVQADIDQAEGGEVSHGSP